MAFAVLALQFPDERGLTPASTSISLFRDLPVDLFFWGSFVGMALFIGWVYLLVASASNGVNIADGLDGLASGSLVISMGAYVVIGFWQFNQSCATVTQNLASCYQVRDPLDLAVVATCHSGRLHRFSLVEHLAGSDFHGGHRFVGPRRRPGRSRHCV